MEPFIKVTMFICICVVIANFLWDLFSLFELFIQYLESITAKNEEQVKLYAVIRKKQELIRKKMMLSISRDFSVPIEILNTDDDKQDDKKPDKEQLTEYL